MLLGWDYETWERAFAWAGETMPSGSYGREDFARYTSVRCKWLQRGGPMTGPISKLELTA